MNTGSNGYFTVMNALGYYMTGVSSTYYVESPPRMRLRSRAQQDDIQNRWNNRCRQRLENATLNCGRPTPCKKM